MEKKAYFLKHLGNGNIMTITDMNRKYCETIVKTKREYILLDENEQSMCLLRFHLVKLIHELGICNVAGFILIKDAEDCCKVLSSHFHQ